jgi:hypothetical protein
MIFTENAGTLATCWFCNPLSGGAKSITAAGVFFTMITAMVILLILRSHKKSATYPPAYNSVPSPAIDQEVPCCISATLTLEKRVSPFVT